jgi:hypothetical protein
MKGKGLNRIINEISFLHYFFFIGCILAELYTGYPLFPGENEVEQLACIMEILGVPPEDVINQATRRRLFFGEFHFRLLISRQFLTHIFNRKIQIQEAVQDALQIQKDANASPDQKLYRKLYVVMTHCSLILSANVWSE